MSARVIVRPRTLYATTTRSRSRAYTERRIGGAERRSGGVCVRPRDRAKHCRFDTVRCGFRRERERAVPCVYAQLAHCAGATVPPYTECCIQPRGVILNSRDSTPAYYRSWRDNAPVPRHGTPPFEGTPRANPPKGK